MESRRAIGGLDDLNEACRHLRSPTAAQASHLVFRCCTIQPWLARRLLAIMGIAPCYNINHYGDNDGDDLGARSTGRAYRCSLAVPRDGPCRAKTNIVGHLDPAYPNALGSLYVELL